MTPSQPLPAPAAVGLLLSRLLGRAAKHKRVSPLALRTQQPMIVALYVRDDEAIAAVVISDLSFGVHAGSALTMIPTDAAEEHLKRGRIEEAIFENYREILNVIASLFNADDGPHVKLHSVHRAPTDPVPEAARDLIQKPMARLDLEVEVTGYGGGRLSFLVS